MDLLVSPIPQLHTMNPVLGEGRLGTLHDSAVGFSEGRVVYVGPTAQAPDARRVVDGRGCVGLPGLVDCHTHSLFAGSRAAEFQKRLAGDSYTSILEAGGGILSTVRATRAAEDADLRLLLHQRLQGFLRSGVTTVEVKSGYGLSVSEEIRLCRILAEGDWPLQVWPTFLGAHAIPLEFRSDRSAYVRAIIEEMIPAIQDSVCAVDVYCDRGAFSLEETQQILQAGLAAGLDGRVHAEQVEYTGVAAMAAQMGCRSVDHLEQLDAAGVQAVADSDCVAVLLPGAQLYLNDPSPPARALAEAGVSLAVATDFNPGSSPVRDLLGCATLACLRMGLTVEEALLGITKNAAKALGCEKRGWLGPDSAADFALFELPPGETDSTSLVQYLGGHSTRAVVHKGRLVWSST
jgi:imidazolonepropionase